MGTDVNAPKVLSSLPSVDEVLRSEAGQYAVVAYGRSRSTAAIRGCVDDARQSLRSGQGTAPTISDIGHRVLVVLASRNAPSARPVFNLTGVVLHTNLGRAILPIEAVEAAVTAMSSAVALEFDLASGGRGERDDLVRERLCQLTGAEDAIAVNNNAAAVLLVLAALASGKETVVSRGELIEIGGAFRLPAIMESAGTVLREVGTTNRTHARDYVEAIGPQTGLVMKVHKSNFAIHGFTKEVSIRELAGIAGAKAIPVVDDLGSGTLVDLSHYGLGRERTVQDAVREGADLVTFSGDKLLGGPQAGFIIGRADLVQRCAKHPLKRAMRLDKIRLGALEATLRLYEDPDTLHEKLPTLRWLARPAAQVAEVARALRDDVCRWAGPEWSVEVADCASQIGSGARPIETLPSAGLRLRAVSGSGSALAAMSARLRQLPVPVIGYVSEGSVWLDLRCLDDAEDFRRNIAQP
jgi:L-seryl-tRNA(Ser) seleniumtransferase